MENKFDTGNLFMNGENYRGKTPPGEFKVTIPKNPLLSITSDYQPTVEPLPQIQLDLYCSGNFSVQCTNPNT